MLLLVSTLHNSHTHESQNKYESHTNTNILTVSLKSATTTNGVFFSTIKCALFISKNAISCLFLKNVSPSKRMICFIPNNLHFLKAEGIAFYALYKSRVLLIPCTILKISALQRMKEYNSDGLEGKQLGIALGLKEFLTTLMVFSFLPKNVHFISKNSVSCLFLKNVSPSKRVICFILNNSHLQMVEGIAFYALYKSRVKRRKIYSTTEEKPEYFSK